MEHFLEENKEKVHFKIDCTNKVSIFPKKLAGNALLCFKAINSLFNRIFTLSDYYASNFRDIVSGSLILALN